MYGCDATFCDDMLEYHAARPAVHASDGWSARYAAQMRIGVYVDGYNLYYGGRKHCGRGASGWRWLDIRALAEALVEEQPGWSNGRLERVVYCTARIDGRTNPLGQAEQDVYLKALLATTSVDHIEYGNYVSRVKQSVLAIRDKKGRPVVSTPDWPVMIQDSNGTKVTDARFMVSYLHNEEKGSDVNVATHLLADVLIGRVDAAIVITNDSDLRLPVQMARQQIPVGLVNPGSGFLAGALRANANDGVGNHWFRQLEPTHFTANQLPNPAGSFTRPAAW